MSSPRAVLILPSTSLGGAERMVIRLTNNLAENNVDTHLIMLTNDGALSDSIANNVTTHTLNVKRARNAPFSLYNAVRPLRPDVLFSSHARLNFVTVGLRKILPGSPRVVIREASNPIADMAIQQTTRIYGPLYKWLYPRADALVCQSQQMVADFDTLMGRRLENIVQIYNPARPDMIAANASDTPSPFTTPATHQLLTCGSLTHRKGYDLLLNALAPLKQSGVDFRLTLLGDGPERESLEALCNSLGLREHVHFNGQTMDNTPWYLHADVFIQPSRIEGLPNTVIEAMACGTPVVATDCPGGTRELLQHGKNGLLAETENVAALTEAVETLLATQDQYPADAVRSSVSHLHPDTVFPRFRKTILGPLFSD